MSTYENRKNANVPAGYVATYGQNGITYKKTTPATSQTSGSCVNWLIAGAVVVLVIVVIFAGLTIFEDGSFRLFNLVSGCLPGGLCNL